MKKQSLRKYGIYAIVFLVIQYLLGMYSNMFVQFPEKAHDGQLWQFAWRQWPLALHMIVGYGLFISFLTLSIRAIRQKNKNWIIASVISFLAITGAISAGSLFIPTQSDVYSYIMSVCFIIAFVAVGWGIYKDGLVSKAGLL